MQENTTENPGEVPLPGPETLYTLARDDVTAYQRLLAANHTVPEQLAELLMAKDSAGNAAVYWLAKHLPEAYRDLLRSIPSHTESYSALLAAQFRQDDTAIDALYWLSESFPEEYGNLLASTEHADHLQRLAMASYQEGTTRQDALYNVAQTKPQQYYDLLLRWHDQPWLEQALLARHEIADAKIHATYWLARETIEKYTDLLQQYMLGEQYRLLEPLLQAQYITEDCTLSGAYLVAEHDLEKYIELVEALRNNLPLLFSVLTASCQDTDTDSWAMAYLAAQRPEIFWDALQQLLPCFSRTNAALRKRLTLAGVRYDLLMLVSLQPNNPEAISHCQSYLHSLRQQHPQLYPLALQAKVEAEEASSELARLNLRTYLALNDASFVEEMITGSVKNYQDYLQLLLEWLHEPDLLATAMLAEYPGYRYAVHWLAQDSDLFCTLLDHLVQDCKELFTNPHYQQVLQVLFSSHSEKGYAMQAFVDKYAEASTALCLLALQLPSSHLFAEIANAHVGILIYFARRDLDRWSKLAESVCHNPVALSRLLRAPAVNGVAPAYYLLASKRHSSWQVLQYLVRFPEMLSDFLALQNRAGLEPRPIVFNMAENHPKAFCKLAKFIDKYHPELAHLVAGAQYKSAGRTKSAMEVARKIEWSSGSEDNLSDQDSDTGSVASTDSLTCSRSLHLMARKCAIRNRAVEPWQSERCVVENYPASNTVAGEIRPRRRV